MDAGPVARATVAPAGATGNAARFDGTLTAKGRVEIQAKGVVRGEIHAPCLMIEAGGIFDGRCHMTGGAEGQEPLAIPIRAAAAALQG